MTRGRRRVTARQLEIIDLLSRPGATQETVAEQLDLAVSTIKAHVRLAYLVLGVRSLAQAVRLLRRELRPPVR